MSGYWTEDDSGNSIYVSDPYSNPGFVGPQSDGTYQVPATVQANNGPVDVGGTPAGSYSGNISDIFKYGLQVLGTVGNYNLASQALDYKRYEATQGGLYVQGRPAGVVTAKTSGLNSGVLLVAGAIVLALVLIPRKG